MPRRVFAFSRCFLLLFTTLAFPLIGASTVARAERSVAASPKGTSQAAPVSATEIPSLRTPTSRTYLGPDGNYTTEISAGAINYRDDSGEYRPIDNTLVPTDAPGYAHRNKANDYTVNLPASLANAVRVQRGSSWITFALERAGGTAVVSGNTATFADALPGVAVSYAALGHALKETITLKDASAPNVFSYDVRTSAGLAARRNARGGIEFVDAGGGTRFAFAAPFMYDSSGTLAGLSRAVTMDLEPTSSGYRVTLTADRAWLSSSARRWPVVIDPTLVTLTAFFEDCMISSGQPDARLCDGGTVYLDVGYDGAAISRSTLRFNLASVPSRSQILHASLFLYLERTSSALATSVDVHRLTQTWNDQASWNRYDGTNPWARPGGDFDTAVASTAPAGTMAPRKLTWQTTSLVQEWVNGAAPNHGFLLKQAGEATNNRLSFVSAESIYEDKVPKLHVTYAQRIGLRRTYKLESQQLGDRARLAVNVASGNLVLEADDLAIPGTGVDLELDRYFNSRGTDTGSYGARWALGAGRDVRLEFVGSDIIFVGRSGFCVTFTGNGDGSYASPSAIDARVSKDGDGGYTLTFNHTGEKLKFGPNNGTTLFLTARSDKNQNRISYSYDAGGKLSSVTDTRGRRTQFAYTAAGYVSSITDAASRVWRYGYDASNRLTSYTDPAGKVTRYEYAGDGDLTKVIDPLGNETRLAYDSLDRVTSLIRVTDLGAGTGPTTAYTYNAGNTVATDPRGNRTTYYYDNEGRVTRVVDALGRERSATYTANGDADSDTDALGKIGRASYDEKNNLTSTETATGARERWTYELTGPHPFYPSSWADAQGNRTSYEYDAAGNLTGVTNAAAAQNRASATYNANGTVATATDFKGTVTRYSYDASGQLTRVDHPDPLGDESYTYDSLSRVATATDGKGQTTRYAYDTLDRVTTLTFHDGSQITYAYDANGNLTSMADNTGTSSFAYDRLNRLTQESLPGGKTNGYGYDGSSNLTSFTDVGGTVAYLYNAADELTTLTEPVGPGSRQTTFLYDANGSRTQTNYPNGVSLFTSYDDAGNVLSIVGKKPASGQVLTSYSYSYTDGAGTARDLRQSVTDGVTGVTTRYGYDVLNRLTSASGGGASYSYAYDANSNRTSQTVNGATTSYAHNAADQLTATGSTTYSYDANGNETGNSAGRSFTYNAKDQTVSARPAGGSAISMSYTGAGQFRRVTLGGTAFTHSRLGLTRENTTSYTRDDGGFLVSLRSSGGNLYPLVDGLGSVTALTDSSGSVGATYAYEPFGKLVSSTGSVANPYRWLGALGVYFDAATALHKMGTRYYDAALGRFTQVDPAPGGGLNRYDYGAQDPINNSDVDGEITCKRCKRLARSVRRPALIGIGTLLWVGGIGMVLGGAVHLVGCVPGSAALGFAGIVAGPMCVSSALTAIAAGAGAILLGRELVREGYYGKRKRYRRRR